MSLYREELVQEILTLYTTGEYTVRQLCKTVGITATTFYAWQEAHPDFSERLKQARKAQLARLTDLARTGLATLLQVTEVEETTTEYTYDKEGLNKTLRAKRVTKRKVMPNVTAVMYQLNNLDSDNYRHKDARRDEEEENEGRVIVSVREA